MLKRTVQLEHQRKGYPHNDVTFYSFGYKP
jgi:hypothetical protein